VIRRSHNLERSVRRGGVFERNHDVTTLDATLTGIQIVELHCVRSLRWPEGTSSPPALRTRPVPTVSHVRYASARGHLFEEINSKGVLYCSLVRINLSCEVRVCADGCTIPVITQPLNESRLSVLRTRLCIGVRVFSVSGANRYEQDNNPEHLHNFTYQDSRLERPERPFRRGVGFISPPRYSPI
jgi:hypothetical protein